MAVKKEEKKEKETKKTENKIDTKKIKKEIDTYIYEKEEEITESILKKVDEQVEVSVTKRMKEEEKKFIRGKNGKIVRRDFVILLLLLAVGYFGYCLYKVDYFHIREKIVEVPVVKEEPKKEEKDATYYIQNYRTLVDNLQIEDDAIFSYYSGALTASNLSNDTKLKIAYKNMPTSQMEKNNGMITFKTGDLYESMKRIFGNDVVLNNEVFSYNTTQFMFYDDTYIGLDSPKNTIPVVYQIYDAREENGELSFDVLVGKVVENHLFTLDDVLILEEYNQANLNDYKENLYRYRYTFEMKEDQFIFKSIVRI